MEWFVLGVLFFFFGLEKICDCISDYAYHKYGKGRAGYQSSIEEGEDE